MLKEKYFPPASGESKKFLTAVLPEHQARSGCAVFSRSTGISQAVINSNFWPDAAPVSEGSFAAVSVSGSLFYPNAGEKNWKK